MSIVNPSYITKGNDQYSVTVIEDTGKYTYLICLKRGDDFKILQIPCKSFETELQAYNDAVDFINKHN